MKFEAPVFEAFLSDPWAPHPVVNRHVCNGGEKSPGKDILEAIPLIAANFIPGVGEVADATVGEDALGGIGAGIASGTDALTAGVGALDAGASVGGGAEALGAGGDAGPSFLGAAPGGASLGAGAGADAGVLGDSGFSSLADGVLGGTPGDASVGVSGVAAPDTGVADAGGVVPGSGSLTGTTSAAAGATPASAVDPFNLPTGATAGGAPSTTLPGTASGSVSGELSSFGEPTAGATGAAPVDPAAAGTAATPGAPGDFPFADQSGAFGGLGNNPIPTTADFGGPVGTTVASNGSSGLGGISDFFKQNKNLLGGALGVAGLGRQLLGGAQTGPNQQALQQLLQQLQQQYQQLQSGQLTPQQSQQFANNLQATIAQIKATYAAHGQGGNSTSAMEDEAAAQAANTAGQAQTMSQNLNTGLQAAGLTANTANSLLTTELQQDAALSQAISRLAAAGLS